MEVAGNFSALKGERLKAAVFLRAPVQVMLI
jgi:hypothetical protein